MEELIVLDESYLPQMTELFRSVFTREPWNDDWSDLEMLEQYVREVSGGYLSLNYGLFIDGRLAALSMGEIRHWWEGTNYNINELCVAYDLQGQGIGTRFLKMIEADVRKRGAAGIFLQTEADRPSFDFYRKQGYRTLTPHLSMFKLLK